MTIRSGHCVVVPVSVGYQVPSQLADSLSVVKVTAKVTNRKGAGVGTVSMSSTASALSGTVTGQFRWCGGYGLGKVTFAKVTGSWVGTQTYAKLSKPTPQEVSGVFTSASTVKIHVRSAVRFVDPTIHAKGAIKRLTVKFRAYRPTSEHWTGIGPGVRVSVQKKVGGEWVTIGAARTSKTAGKASLKWRSKAQASYRLVWKGSGTKKAAVSASFRG